MKNISRNKVLVCLILFFCIILCSCNSFKIPKNTKIALEYAKGNKKELQKVLNYYSIKKTDKLKFKAACYLIENMPGHFYKYYPEFQKFDSIFKNIGENTPDSVFKNELWDVKRAIWDSYAPVFKGFQHENLQDRYDIHFITSTFVINNIEETFNTWKKYPWCRNLTFKEIKEYILPYRVLNEPLSEYRKYFQEKYNWLIDSLKDNTNMEEAFSIIYKDFYKNSFSSPGGFSYPINMSYKQTENSKGGHCEDGCILLITILRSLGIKSVYDYSVSFSNRTNVAHSWVAFPYDNDNTKIIDNDNKLKIAENFHGATIEFDSNDIKYLSDTINYQKFKKGTKIKRFSYKINKESLFFNLSENLNVPKSMSYDVFCFDITSHYIRCKDVNIKVPNSFKNEKLFFLTTFQKNGFEPIDWTISQNGIIKFKDIGTNSVYFPAIYLNNKYVPFSTPFILQENGNLNMIHADKQKLQKIILYRKYPLFVNIISKMNLIRGGVIQGANEKNFSDAQILLEIDSTVIQPTEMFVENQNLFRYYRFVPLIGSKGDIAELGFYQNNKKLKGEIIFNYEGAYNREPNKAFDDNFETYYMSTKTNTWIGIDFGKQQIVTKILFAPRSDANFIIPNNEYELNYWDGEWIPIEKKIADSYYITFENVPEDALLWLKCITEGREERPFTYKNSQQIWW